MYSRKFIYKKKKKNCVLNALCLNNNISSGDNSLYVSTFFRQRCDGDAQSIFIWNAMDSWNYSSMSKPSMLNRCRRNSRNFWLQLNQLWMWPEIRFYVLISRILSNSPIIFMPEFPNTHQNGLTHSCSPNFKYWNLWATILWSYRDIFFSFGFSMFSYRSCCCSINWQLYCEPFLKKRGEDMFNLDWNAFGMWVGFIY